MSLDIRRQNFQRRTFKTGHMYNHYLESPVQSIPMQPLVDTSPQPPATLDSAPDMSVLQRDGPAQSLTRTSQGLQQRRKWGGFHSERKQTSKTWFHF